MPKIGALLVGLGPKTLALERSHRSPDVSFTFTMAMLHEILCHSVSVDGLLVPMRGEHPPRAYVRVLSRAPSEYAFRVRQGPTSARVRPLIRAWAAPPTRDIAGAHAT